MFSAIRFTLAISLLLLLSTTAAAAPMVRVIAVRDCRTIIVDDRGVAATLQLGQIVVPPGEEQLAADWLRSAIVSSWVLVETDSRGESYVYRSPDSLFVNGEIARRAYRSSGTPMVWLGEADPGPQRTIATKPIKEKTITISGPAKPQRARTSPRGAHRIPRTK